MTREEATYLLNNLRSVAEGKEDEAIDMAIEALQEVQKHKADRPEGEWQKVDSQPYFRKHFDNVCCSVCHHKGMRKYNYCPNCGAMMTPYKGGDSE